MPSSALICVRFRLNASSAPLNFPSVPLEISAHGSAPRTCRLPSVRMLRSPAVHLDFDLLGQFAAQVIDVNACTAIHQGGIFTCE